MQFANVRDLTRLPYFSVSNDGKLALKDGVIDEVFDIHTHLGWSFLMGKKIDLWKKCSVKYFFPEDEKFDLNKHLLAELSPVNRSRCKREVVRGIVDTHGYSQTHTIPNLMAEMDCMKVKQAVVLAIDLPRLSKNSENLLEAINKIDECKERLIPYISMHPGYVQKHRRLKLLTGLGAKGIKLHPQMQLFRLHTKRAEPIYQLAKQFNLPILSHTGLAPIAPRWQRRFVQLNHLIRSIRSHQDVTFIIGHSAMEDYDVAVQLANSLPHVYLDLSGQTASHQKDIIKATDSNKLLYGSDWPFYPMAIPMAKTLLATEGKNKHLRSKIFWENAQQLLRD